MPDVPAKIDYEVEDNASANLKSIRKEWEKNKKSVDDVSKSTDDAADSSEKMNKSSKGLIGSLDKLDVIATGAAAGLTAFAAQGVQAFEETESASQRYEFRLQSLGQTQGDLNRLNAEMKSNFDRLGFSVENQEQVMTRLATKTSDVEYSTRLLQDAMDTSVATGENFVDVSKDIAEAATGDINALEELGVLTEEQTDRLREIDDAGRRASEALDLLRQKVGGASEEIDPQVRALRQMKAGYRDLNAEAGKFVLTAGELALRLVTLNTLGSENATATSDMATGLEKANIGLGALLTYIDELDNQKGIKEQSDSVMKLQAGFYELIGAEEEATELTRIRLGITENQTTAQQELADAIRRYGRDSDEAARAAKRYNETLRETNELSRDQQRINRGFADSAFPQLDGGNPVIRANQPDPTPDTDPEEEYASRAELERRKANIAYEAQQGHEDRLAELRQKRRDREFEKEQEARDRRVAREVEAIEAEHAAWLETHEDRKQRIEAEVDERREALRSGFQGASSGLADAGAMLSGFDAELSRVDALNDAERERLDTMHAQNDALRQNLDHMSSIASAGGDIAMSIDGVFQKQWDFKEAASETVSAFDSLSSVAGAVAGVGIEDAKKLAKVKAGIHFAAAAGALGFGFATGQPQYFAAAAKHTSSGIGYSAVAGQGKGNADTSGIGAGGGASGGGASGVNRPQTIDLGSVKQANKEAFAEALRETQNESREVTYLVDQRGAILLERDPTTARKTRRTLDVAERNTLRLGA